METKAEPGPNSCHAKALPDEPMFILLARDRCAPAAIRSWADARSNLAIAEDWSEDAERITDALETADAMEAWRIANDGAWRKASEPAPVRSAPELLDIANRILTRTPVLAGAVDRGSMVSAEKFNTLLADAKKLAALVEQRGLAGAPVDA